MLVSAPSSAIAPSTNLIGQVPSGRWVVRHHSYARSAASTSPATSSAIAASTWFQTSTLSPTVQGIAPSASCIPTIVAAVRATSSAVRTPSRKGICGLTGRSGPGLAEVEHHALADERVEQLAGDLQRLGLLHDLPHQELVVGPCQRVSVVGDAHRALDPPVRRVQAVGVVLALEDHRVAGLTVVG